MCGIVGIYLKTKKFEKNLGKMLSGMLNNMESRGPDSAGFATVSYTHLTLPTILLV